MNIYKTQDQLVQPLLRTVWRFLKKLKIGLPQDPAIPLLGIYPGKTLIRKNTCTSMFIAALFTLAKTWKQPKYPSIDEWIKKMWCKEWKIPFAATWMGLEIIILSEVSQSDRERQISHDITYMWNLKNSTNEIIYKTETYSQM